MHSFRSSKISYNSTVNGENGQAYNTTSKLNEPVRLVGQMKRRPTGIQRPGCLEFQGD